MSDINKSISSNKLIFGLVGLVLFAIVGYLLYDNIYNKITNGKKVDGVLICDDGYILNEKKDNCTFSNGKKVDGVLTCNTGYKLNEKKDNCIILNGTKKAGVITCDTGYKLNTAKDGCILNTITTDNTTPPVTTPPVTTPTVTTPTVTTPSVTTPSVTTPPVTTPPVTTPSVITPPVTTPPVTTPPVITPPVITPPVTTPPVTTPGAATETDEIKCYNQDTKNFSYIYNESKCKTCKDYLKLTLTDDIYNNITFTNTKNCNISSCPTTHIVNSTKNNCIIKCKEGQ